MFVIFCKNKSFMLCKQVCCGRAQDPHPAGRAIYRLHIFLAKSTTCLYIASYELCTERRQASSQALATISPCWLSWLSLPLSTTCCAFATFLRHYRLSLSLCALAKYSAGVITGMSCLTKSLTFRVTITSAFAASAE